MLTLSVPDESYSRISSSALNYIFTCLLSQTYRRSVVFYVSIVTDLRQIGGCLRVYCPRLTADRWLFTCLLSQTYRRSVVVYMSIVPDLRQIGGFLRVYCHRLTADRWCSLCTTVSSTNKTDHHHITEILLKVALSTITL